MPTHVELRRQLSAQRTEGMLKQRYTLAGGVVDRCPAPPATVREGFTAYYRPPRGYHPRSLNSNNGWNKPRTCDASTRPS